MFGYGYDGSSYGRDNTRRVIIRCLSVNFHCDFTYGTVTAQARTLSTAPEAHHVISRMNTRFNGASLICSGEPTSGYNTNSATHVLPKGICSAVNHILSLAAAMVGTHDASTSNSDELLPLGAPRNSGGSGGSGAGGTSLQAQICHTLRQTPLTNSRTHAGWDCRVRIRDTFWIKPQYHARTRHSRPTSEPGLTEDACSSASEPAWQRLLR